MTEPYTKTDAAMRLLRTVDELETFLADGGQVTVSSESEELRQQLDHVKGENAVLKERQEMAKKRLDKVIQTIAKEGGAHGA